MINYRVLTKNIKYLCQKIETNRLLKECANLKDEGFTQFYSLLLYKFWFLQPLCLILVIRNRKNLRRFIFFSVPKLSRTVRLGQNNIDIYVRQKLMFKEYLVYQETSYTILWWTKQGHSSIFFQFLTTSMPKDKFS